MEQNCCWGRCLVWREGNCSATLQPLSLVLEQGELGAETADQAAFDQRGPGKRQRPQLCTACTWRAGLAIAKCKPRVSCVDLMLNTSLVLPTSKPCSATDLNSSKVTGFLRPAHWPGDFLPWFFLSEVMGATFPYLPCSHARKVMELRLEGHV